MLTPDGGWLALALVGGVPYLGLIYKLVVVRYRYQLALQDKPTATIVAIGDVAARPGGDARLPEPGGREHHDGSSVPPELAA